MKNKNIFLIIMFFLAFAPKVSAYALPLEVPRLYDVFIDIFGNFWLSVLIIMGILFIILILGKLSQKTIIPILGLFILIMSIGYGFLAISALITIGIIFWSVSQIIKLINNQSYG